MVDWLIVWGVTGLVFKPILESLAKEVAKDVAKSYVGKCFKSVFSVIHKDALAKATGLALKELLELIENELVRADKSEDEIRGYVEDVRRFIQRAAIRDAIAALFLDPDYHLDPRIFAGNWREMKDARTLPDGFSWQFISRQFARKVADIRHSSTDLRETFASLITEKGTAAQVELVGLPPGFDLDTYREALLERYGNLDFASLDSTGAFYSNVRLWSVFTPQSVRECHEYDPQLLELPKEHLRRLVEKGELDREQLTQAEQLADLEELREERRRAYVSQSPKPVLSVTDDAMIQRLVILGDPGSGKSSLLRYLALRWARIADANRRYTEPLPLLIELREYKQWPCSNGKSFPKYLHEAPTWHRLNQQTLKHLLEQPERVVLMLDGLDEVFDPTEREQVVNDIHRFSNAYKHVRVVVTTRVVGYKPQRLRDADFRHFMLQDLDSDQIDAFLERWHKVTFDKAEDGAAKRERLAKAIDDSKSIAQLAGNPLLLTMMAILNRHQELPRDRADLYQQCARLLLHQWDTERGLKDFPALRGQVDLRAKVEILQSIAEHMQTSPAGLSGNIIDGKTLTDLIEDYLRTELHFDQSREAANALVAQLRERNFILCYLGADSYAFVHRTFLEYFCATEIVHQFNVAKTLDEKGLIALFDDHCSDDDWREVLRLVCGQIDEQFVGKIVEYLATRTNLDEWDGRTPLPELPLAIECLSEVRNPNRLEKTGGALLKQVVAYIVNSGLLFTSSEDGLMSAVRELGARWPGREWLCTQIQSVPLEIKGRGVLLWPQLVADVLCDRSINESYSHQTYTASVFGISAFRCAALQALAEKWPDDRTRELLQERAVEDDEGAVRRAALRALAEKLPDDKTREFLEKRAVKDNEGYVRGAALEALVEKWPDDRTREFFLGRILRAPHSEPRGAASAALGKMHSEFGGILPSRDLDIFGPYLDPLEPIQRDHIERAAKMAGIPPDEIDAQVASLSAHLGWDITKGAKAGRFADPPEENE